MSSNKTMFKTNPQQKWDLQFFHCYIPKLLYQLNKIDMIFQLYCHTISQFKHKLSSILIQQPPYIFQANITKNIYSSIRFIIQHMDQTMKQEIDGIVNKVKQYKQVIQQLNCCYQDNQRKGKNNIQKLQKLIKQYQYYQKQQIQIQKHTKNKSNKSININFINMNNKSIINKNKNNQNNVHLYLYEKTIQNKQKYLTDKLQLIKIEIEQCQKLQEIYCLQQNNSIRKCLGLLDKYGNRISQFMKNKVIQTNVIGKDKGKFERFQTFNRARQSGQTIKDIIQIPELNKDNQVGAVNKNSSNIQNIMSNKTNRNPATNTNNINNTNPSQIPTISNLNPHNPLPINTNTNITNNNTNNNINRAPNSPNTQISQFMNQDIYTIIQQAQSNCQDTAYININRHNTQQIDKILDAAILAQSRDQDYYSQQEVSRRNRYKPRPSI